MSRAREIAEQYACTCFMNNDEIHFLKGEEKRQAMKKRGDVQFDMLLIEQAIQQFAREMAEKIRAHAPELNPASDDQDVGYNVGLERAIGLILDAAGIGGGDER